MLHPKFLKQPLDTKTSSATQLHEAKAQSRDQKERRRSHTKPTQKPCKIIGFPEGSLRYKTCSVTFWVSRGPVRMFSGPTSEHLKVKISKPTSGHRKCYTKSFWSNLWTPRPRSQLKTTKRSKATSGHQEMKILNRPLDTWNVTPKISKATSGHQVLVRNSTSRSESTKPR